MQGVMMKTRFRKYDHVERLDHPDVEGIDIGEVHIFPKIDGTNASVWLDDATLVEDEPSLRCGSRRRQIGTESDNHGFAAWIEEHRGAWLALFRQRPGWIIYGEWLVPHTLKTYRDNAWRRFWVFDVFDVDSGRYVPFDDYVELLDAHDVDVIWPLAVATNPTRDSVAGWVKANTFLIKDGEGAGEGIVLKNYAWTNLYGRQPWAKIVRNEFKEQHKKAMGVPTPDGAFQVELAAVEELLTAEMVQKTLMRIQHEVIGWTPDGGDDEDIANAISDCEANRGKIIPRLLETVYHDFVVEETWTILKKWKQHQTIDFKRLRAAVIARTKSLTPELF